MKKKYFPIFLLLAAAAIFILLVKQFFVLQSAHSSFAQYYHFRGCAKLISRSTTSGVCQLPSGEKITLVESHQRWYLQGDLPGCFFGFCLQ